MSAAVATPAKPTTGGGRPTVYKLKDGTRVPGASTIAGKYKEPGGLIFWAWKLGTEGKDFRKVRDDAADVGHHGHALIDADIHGRPPPARPYGMSDEDEKRARTAYEAFCQWRDMVRLEIVDTERPLVSEMHRYGGTYDAIARVNGQTVLLDWKTGGSVHLEHLAQLAAYRQLIRESLGNDREMAPTGAVLLRVGKEFGDFHDHFFPSDVLDAAWERFQASKWMYEVDQRLGKVV